MAGVRKKIKSKIKRLLHFSDNLQPGQENPATARSSSGSAAAPHISVYAQGVSQSTASAVLLSVSSPPDVHSAPISSSSRSSEVQISVAPGNVEPLGEDRPEYPGWGGLELFANTISKSAGVFGPLKEAADALISFVATFETAAKNRKDCQELKKQLNNLLRDISQYFDPCAPPTITWSIENLAKELVRETNFIGKKRGQSDMGSYWNAEQDAEDVLKCYQRIQALLQRLFLNANLNTWQTVDEILTENRLGRLPNSLAAYYRSADAASLRRGGCTKDTRVDVLDQLLAWSRDAESQKIYWLNGMAGTGKTTIAYTLCELLESEKTLAASFFCSRQLPECRNVNRIVPSIAYQLSRFSRPFCHVVSPVMESNPDVYNQPILQQFEQLVVQPVKKVQNALPTNLVVVIDALDECNAETGVDDILSVLLSYAHELPIRFFVTSRPDIHILDRMQSEKAAQVKTEMRLHELAHPTVQKDIRTYLKTMLDPHLVIPEVDLDTLVQRSGVLFIYAATVVRYVGANKFAWKRSRLAEVLRASSSASAENNKEIDALYHAILCAAFDNPELASSNRADMRQILDTVVCACEPLTVDTIAGLLSLDSEESVYPALVPLFSVLQISGADRIITTLHESFPNYITIKKRSDRFHCDKLEHNGRLAERCFDQISRQSPSFNVCQLESSYMLDENVPGIKDRIEEAVSKKLFYACQYWGSHLRMGVYSQRLADDLLVFLSGHFLLWVEVMSLKKCVGDSMKAMYEMEEWSRITKELSDEVRLLVGDAWRFVTSWASSPMPLSTPHIYVSALSFWPKRNPLAKCYEQKYLHTINKSSTAMDVRKVPPLATINTRLELLCLAYSPNSLSIAVGAKASTLLIWDARTGQVAGQPLKGHQDDVNSVAFSPNGRWLASGSSDSTVRIWDALTGQPVCQPFKGHTGPVRSVAFSPNGKHVASGSDDRRICVWDTSSGDLISQSLEVHMGPVRSVAYSPNGAHITTGSDDKTICVWNAKDSTLVGQPLEGHQWRVYSVVYSPDGKCIMSASMDDTIRIWDALTGQSVGQPLQGHTGTIYCATYSPNGSYAVSGSQDYSVRIWNAFTGQPVGQPLTDHTGAIVSVSYSPDGKYIASGSTDGAIHIWDALMAPPAGQPLESHASDVNSVAYSPDSKHIVSGSLDKTVRIWDALTGQPVGQPLQGHSEWVWSVAYSPDGKHIISGSSDCTIRIWDALTGQAVGQPLVGHTDWVSSVAYSPDGKRIASGSSDETVRIWDVLTGQAVGQPLTGHTDWIWSVIYSPSGGHIISGSGDHTIRIWDALAGQLIGQALQGHTECVTSLAYSPDGAYIISGSDDKTIRIWDTLTGHPVGQPLKGHTGWVSSVTYSHDGKHIIFGSSNNTIRIWDAQTGQPVGQPLHGHTSDVRSVACSPDGRFMVSGSRDNTIRVWDLQTNRAISESFSPHTELPSASYSALATDNDERAKTHICASACQIDGNHRPWTLNEDGWVVIDGNKLLVWVPPDLRDVLVRPQNTILTSSKYGALYLDFDDRRMGEHWAEHFTPLKPSGLSTE